MKKIILIALTALLLINCRPDKVSTDPTANVPVVGELKIEDIKLGTGEMLKKDNKMVVHYKGWLTDGFEFANTYKNGNPFIITFGSGELIKGWEQGLLDMQVGGIRKLTIPPHLAYGNRGLRNIPPNSTLIFEIKLVNILH